MSEQKRVFRFYWAWEDHREEVWLERMAREGWQLVQGGVLFTFQRAEPAEVRYRLDYRPGGSGGLKDYLLLFRDAGWEHVCSFFGWQYFRSPAEANAPEIYTDTTSRIEKYQRLKKLILVLFIVNLWNGVSLLATAPSHSSFASLFEVLRVAPLAVAGFLAYGAWRLNGLISRLRERSGIECAK